jgi:hypothetical protein
LKTQGGDHDLHTSKSEPKSGLGDSGGMQSRKNIHIDITHPREGQALCNMHELELIAVLRSGNVPLRLDGDLSAVILVDGEQISHLFSGGLGCRLPWHMLNRTSLLEIIVFSGDGLALSRQQVAYIV